jgi:hypothetical protein
MLNKAIVERNAETASTLLPAARRIGNNTRTRHAKNLASVHHAKVLQTSTDLNTVRRALQHGVNAASVPPATMKAHFERLSKAFYGFLSMHMTFPDLVHPEMAQSMSRARAVTGLLNAGAPVPTYNSIRDLMRLACYVYIFQEHKHAWLRDFIVAVAAHSSPRSRHALYTTIHTTAFDHRHTLRTDARRYNRAIHLLIDIEKRTADRTERRRLEAESMYLGQY